MTLEDLAPIPLFANVSRELLARILPDLKCRTFLQGDALFSSGDSASELLVILHGNVHIERDGSFLATRGENELIGEQALLAEDGFRTATAKAQSFVSALLIPQGVFDILLHDHHFGRNLGCILSKKLTQATKDRGYRYSKETLVFGEFRAHVAQEVLDCLIQGGAAAYGAPRRADAIVLFSDIRDFTRLSADMAPDQIAQDLTTYLNHVVDVVHEHGGMVDKFVGDAVMAVWGAFEDLSSVHARKAFECACRMVETSLDFSFGDQPIRIGVGLNAGNVFVGNVGGDGKRQFTVLGPAVNLASRFESKTKEFNKPIVLGEKVQRLLDSSSRTLLFDEGEVPVKGAADQRLYTFTPL